MRGAQRRSRAARVYKYFFMEDPEEEEMWVIDRYLPAISDDRL
jgi:hypothetical protein